MKLHLMIDVRGALRRAPQSLRGMFSDTTTGRALSVAEATEFLLDHLQQGHVVIPTCDPAKCPDFDYKGEGCPGHEEVATDG